jgi:hypothetical protein
MRELFRRAPGNHVVGLVDYGEPCAGALTCESSPGVVDGASRRRPPADDERRHLAEYVHGALDGRYKRRIGSLRAPDDDRP